MRSDNSPVDSLKNDFDQESTALRAKADRLEKEIDFALKDCYEPIHKVCTLQKKLEGFESWTEFRAEYDRLATQSEGMMRQRVREESSLDQLIHTAREARSNLNQSSSQTRFTR